MDRQPTTECHRGRVGHRLGLSRTPTLKTLLAAPSLRSPNVCQAVGGRQHPRLARHGRLEAEATTFVLNAEVAGMSKLINAALLEQTDLRVNKLAK